MLTVDELKQGLRPLLAAEPGGTASADADAGSAPVAWFDALALRLEDGHLVVGFPHSYFARWFCAHKQAGFESALARCFPDMPGILYEDAPGGLFARQREAEGADGRTRAGETGISAPREDAPDNGALVENALGGDAFDRFIVNAKNAFPLATAKKAAVEGGTADGVALVFCGKSGTGKTELLRAMARTLARRLSREGLTLCGAAKFCAGLGEGAAGTPHGRPEGFWRNCRALLLDDLQDLTGVPGWQRCLAALLDARPAGRLVVFAHAGPARELGRLDERLRCRLESGLVLELLEPDLDVRLRYLQRAVRERDLPLTREQILYLAQRCAQFSLLQGLLRKVEAFAALNGRAPLQADLENIVRTGGSVRPAGCREILGTVAQGFNLRPEDILGARRRPDLVLARQVAMYLCRRKLGLSYPELGRAFGGRDHSTVIHAVKKIRKLLDTDKVVHNLVTELENSVP
ncbi:MAG: chromosomal replication initiator DnaA [Desulfovibrio sp.]|nr:chromosomal replication initiator DnaA [Desulfovibrio sp.]